jgi:DNA-binding response OmpR family regulator
MAKVLLASDDPRTRAELERALAGAGHEVCRVVNFRLAFDGLNFRDHEAVVVELDQRVRREEFVRRARLRGCRGPVLAIGESLPNWQVSRLRALGARTVLQRPVKAGDVVGELSRLL